MKKSSLSLLICMLLVVTGCANQEYFIKNDKYLKDNNLRIKQIALLPFDGEANFGKEVSDAFAMNLVNDLKTSEIKILPPSAARVVMEERKISLTLGDDAQRSKAAQRLAQLLHADAVMMGELNSNRIGSPLKGIVTAKLLDTKTGETIAASHRESGSFFLAQSVQQCIMAAANNVKEDMVWAINESYIPVGAAPEKRSPWLFFLKR
ncbi:MAG: hypothetical protein M0009_00045 [Deltaproteobacteria bacterium]|nr:hypothetical protein [Deltaproteobacteria bacterium]